MRLSALASCTALLALGVAGGGCARPATRSAVAPATAAARPGATWAEPSAAAPYLAVFEPTARLARDGGPRGIMIVIHGGGWQSRGAASVDEPRNLAEVERWRARGWRVVATSHRSSSEGPAEAWPYHALGQVLPVVPGSATWSLEDVVAVHDRIREEEGDDLPLCATGWSSGGHLALMLAASRPDVSCVVALAAPTDLPALVAADTPAGRAAEFAFGREAARMPGDGLSPVDVAGRIQGRLLLATAENDRWVPPSQMEALRAALQGTGSGALLETIVLAPGRQVFWHGRVSDAALADYLAAEDAFAASVAR